MSNNHHQPSDKFAQSQGLSKKINFMARSIAVVGLIAGGSSLGISPAFAASLGGSSIENQATGTFTDGDDPGSPSELVESNIVSVTVAEVAGITITPGTLPIVANGATSNFDFTITNVGNDPTKFSLPQDATVVGGTQGTLQVIAYINAAGTKVTLATPINITAPTTTAALGDGTLGSNTTLGSIPAGAAIVVRVPVVVNVSSGTVSATLGNTAGQPGNNNTPFVIGANGTGTKDVFTFDNTNGSVPTEAAGVPSNGIREASAILSTGIVADPVVTGKVWKDTDASKILDNGELGTEATGTALTVYAVGSDGKVIAKSDVAADGTYSLSVPPNTPGVVLRLVNDSTVNIGAIAPLVPSLPTGWANTGENQNNVIETGTVLGEIPLTVGTANLPAQNFGIRQKAKLVLVKRITAIKNAATGVTTNFTTFNEDTTANDNHCNWKDASTTATPGVCTNTYTVGVTTGTTPQVNSGDEIEYTIYYLNGGENKANPARVCDSLDPNLTFNLQAGSGIGIAKGVIPMVSLTNIGTDSDKGQLTTPALATNCNLPNNSGTQVVVVDVADTSNPLTGSTGAGLPTTSYGYIRFKATVN